MIRLSTFEKPNIINTLCEFFGRNSVIILFGSKADITKSGGDIDLLVETEMKFKSLALIKAQAIAKIQIKIGIQKIDLIITNDRFHDERAVAKEAVKTGIMLKEYYLNHLS